jgi:hypothetical protein
MERVFLLSGFVDSVVVGTLISFQYAYLSEEAVFGGLLVLHLHFELLFTILASLNQEQILLFKG